MKIDRLGICMAGGGAKGIISAGFYQAFAELKFEYQAISGVSVGALNGTLIHQGEAERMIPLWKSIKRSDIYNWHVWDFWKPVSDRACLYDSAPLEKTIRKYANFDKIKANPKPFYIGTTDLKLKRNMVLHALDLEDQEEYIQFLKASASPPIFFPSVNFRGSELGDGGVSDNYNIDVIRDEGCDTIIVFYPSNTPPDPKIDNIKEMLDIVISTPNNSLIYKEIKAIDKVNKIIEVTSGLDPKLKKINLILITPNKPIDVGLLDFDYKETRYTREDLLEIGYQSAYNVLKNLG